MMSKIFLAKLAVVLFFSATTWAAATKIEDGKYNIDPMHTNVGFEVPHLVISSVEGKFKNFSGVLNLVSPLTKSSVEFEVDTTSIDTSVDKRDEHLKSADFFDVTKYPKMTFKSKKVTGNEKSFKLIGDLTIKDKTKEVTFVGSYKGSANDAYGNLKAAFVASAKISRKDFNLTWNKMVEAGPVVGDEITINLKVQAGKEKPAAAEKK